MAIYMHCSSSCCPCCILCALVLSQKNESQCSNPKTAQGPASLGVVFVVVQAEQQLSQVRVYLVVANAGENLEEERGLTAEALYQDAQLCSSTLIQWAQILTDQRTETVTEIQDFIQAMENRFEQDEGLSQQVT